MQRSAWQRSMCLRTAVAAARAGRDPRPPKAQIVSSPGAALDALAGVLDRPPRVGG